MIKSRNLVLAMAVLFVACALGPVARAGTLSTDVIGMFPQNAGEFAYADLRQARGLSWFPQLQNEMLPERFKELEKVLSAAGADPNVQVEELAWALVPGGLPDSSAPNASTAVPTSEQVVGVALGSFQRDSTEAYFEAKKFPVAKVHNLNLYGFAGGSGASDLFFVFIDANTAAFGQRAMLEKLINVRYGEEPGLFSNDELSSLVTKANGSGIVWSVMTGAYTRLAMQQLTPEVSQFPQAQQLTGKVHALTIAITAGTGVQAHFQAVLDNPDDANTFAALLQAGLLYRRYQVANSNPDLAAMLDAISVAPSGDQLDIRLSLTDDQVVGLIRRNTFAVGL